MRHSWLGGTLGGAGLFLALLVPGFAQPSPAAAFAANPDHTITLDVVVSGKSGEPVSGLQEQDFALLDNKQPQKITSFRAEGTNGAAPGTPVEVILLIDEANASFQTASFERIEAQKYLKQNGGALPYPVTLVFLSDTGATIAQTASRDGNALAAELSQSKSPLRTINRTQGFYGAGDRVQLSLKALEQLVSYETPKPGRKLVIWISPGWPLLTGPRVELSSKNQEQIFNSVVTLSTGLRRARIALYSIDPLGTADAGGFRTSYYEGFVKGVRAAKSVQIGNLALQVLATQSGGRVLNSNNDVTAQIARCVADASAFYELSFDALPGDGPNEYHALDMKVDKLGLKAITRTGYYAQVIQVSGK